MFIARDIEHRIHDYLEQEAEHANVLLVHGARQVGKTLLCSQVLSQRSKTHPVFSINLEEKPDIKLLIDSCHNFSDFDGLLRTRLGFLPGNNTVLFIDEAQESKALGGFVRFMKENWPHTKCILTGSSMSRLFDRDTRIPVGRTQEIIVRPFSFREFLRAKDLESYFNPYLKMQEPISETIHLELLRLFDAYVQVGGLPAAVLSSVAESNFREVHALVFASQREDFYRKEKLKDHLFTDAMKAVSRLLGLPSNLSQISSNYRDGKQTIEALKAWHLVVEVEQTGSASTQKIHPKWYLYDLGILSHLRRSSLPMISILDTTDPALRTPLGGILENAVLCQLLSMTKTHHSQNITGWKKNNKQGIEVDFVLHQFSSGKESVIPIEVKASKKVNSYDTNNLKHYLNNAGLRQGFVICLERPRTLMQDSLEIQIIPIYAELGGHSDK